MIKRTIAIGFMLFAMFFGAGNLIFPPNVGWLSGTNFWPAIIGFIVTGVGLPLIGVIAGSFSDEGFRTEMRRVSPWFAVIFMIVIYLTIGPFFAIPRTATVAFEMSTLSFIDLDHSIFLPVAEKIKTTFLASSAITAQTILFQFLLFIFSIIYFAAVFFLSVNPSKIVDRVGAILTPMLLVSMICLILRAYFILNTPQLQVDAIYQSHPFVRGFFEGYQTMDTIAAVAFSFIVLTAVRASGLSDRKEIFKYASIAAVIAGACLGLIYLSLGWVGNHYPIDPVAFAAQNQDRGVFILSNVATMAYGAGGKFLLGVIVMLACLTTAIGLVVAVSSYFQELMPRFSYRTYAIIFTIISFVLSNQGLDQIIKGAVPTLMIVYPVTIVLIVLVFLDKFLRGVPDLAIKLPVYATLTLSVLSVLKTRIPDQAFAVFIERFLQWFYFHESDMEWVIPAVVLFVLGYGIGVLYQRKSMSAA